MLVLLSCAVVALETLPLDRLSVRLLEGVERVANVVFFTEYCMRFYSQNCRPRVLLSKLMLIDFFGCLPLFFQPTEGIALQAVQLLRVARVLRLQRAIEREDFTKLFTRNKNRVGSRKPSVVVSESQLKAAQVVLTVFTLLYATSSLMYAAESQVNPQFSNFFEAFYFSVIGLTTVGLGDIAPITPLGRAIAAGSVITGAFLVPLQLGSLARATMSEMNRPPGRSPSVTSPNSLLTQLGDYGMVDLDAADASSAPPPPAAALARVSASAAVPTSIMPPTTPVVPTPLATAAAAVVATPPAAIAANVPDVAAWNAAFMDASCTSCGLRVHQLDARYCRLCGTVLRSPPPRG
eukprot:TRINITY_DN709_c0_g1_i8.p1 TRINITY_DN709_c0_g1~~TRINITY_DN709_c0_g1_i8.p1  ORF type:complete len:411 (+),score=127.85 TRINITY_DN709_c0_g1_i8:184-1233(+)